MKKFLAVVMTAVLAMSMMTACGSSKSSEENKDTTAAKAETTKAETIDASGWSSYSWSRNGLCTI